MIAPDARLALSAGTAMLALASLLALDSAKLIEFGWGWAIPSLCLIAGSGLLAVAEPGHGAAYTGALTRLGERKGWPVWLLRSVTLLTAPVAGVGILVYAAIALALALDREDQIDWRIDWRRCVATGLLGLAFVLACVELGAVVGNETLLWSVLLAGSGLSLFWWLPEGVRLSGTAEEQDIVLRFHLSLLLTISSVVYLLNASSDAVRGGKGAWPTVAATAVVILIPLLLIGPRWLRTSRALNRERIELARANERTELAGRVHDEVMQTLALIQDRAESPAEVRRLARRQERDLRSWLLEKEPAAAPSHSIASALRAAAAEVEDAHGAQIDVVTVGDGPLDGRAEALVLATREALINAAKYASATPISLFGAIEDQCVSAYVRDRGPGFDLDAIPPDRHGVRESIVARMARHSGCATIRTAPGGGCEIKLVQERQG